ncbi:hypothetical protein AB0G74_27810 [Streptomyces sp. NPDC020875]|uniref:hypothetical protein n=1 Tax=Streptomyces sp. NPDC020875 TaxID=3154898 RepID=UPI0033DAF604
MFEYLCVRPREGKVPEKWIRFTDRIYYEVRELRHAACPECGMDLGLTLVGEPGENPDVICPCDTRFAYPNSWPTWWEEATAKPAFQPQHDARSEES